MSFWKPHLYDCINLYSIVFHINNSHGCCARRGLWKQSYHKVWLSWDKLGKICLHHGDPYTHVCAHLSLYQCKENFLSVGGGLLVLIQCNTSRRHTHLSVISETLIILQISLTWEVSVSTYLNISCLKKYQSQHLLIFSFSQISLFYL